MTLEEALEEKIACAARGRAYWLDLEKKAAIDDKVRVILFPQTGTDCNRYTLKYLPEFAKKEQLDRLVLLAFDPWVLDNKSAAGTPCECIPCSRKQAEELMAYYTLHMFTDKLIIASLDEPQGRNGKNIVGVKGVTQEEAVAIGILGLAKA